MLDKVKHVILVLSGKGGVGKSTVSTQLALSLKDTGYKVGLLDIDLCGPNIPYMLGLEEENIYQSDGGWVPIYADNDKSLAVMSIGFLLKNRNNPVIWRGPKKNSMIKQFLTDVNWDEIDYLIIDTPPGTSDEHISVMESLQEVNSASAILVTTPQCLSLDDVRKEITFCRKTGINILGLIENMSGFVCPHCSNCTHIFSSNGGVSLANAMNIPFIATLPIDPRLNVLIGTTHSALKDFHESSTAEGFRRLVQHICDATKNP